LVAHVSADGRDLSQVCRAQSVSPPVRIPNRDTYNHPLSH